MKFYNPELEASLIGYLLGRNGREGMVKIMSSLTPQDFIESKNRVVYKAMIEMDNAGITIDPITVAEHLNKNGNLEEVGDRAALHTCHASSCTTSQLDDYINMIHTNSVQFRKFKTIEQLHKCMGNGMQGLDLLEFRYQELLKESTKQAKTEVYEANDFANIEFAKGVDYMEEGMVSRKSCTLISAYAKSYKTMFSLNMAISLAAGQDFLGFPIPEPVRVLYLQEEVSVQTIQSRVVKMLRQMPPTQGNLHIVHARGIKLTMKEGLSRVMTIINKVQPQVVFFDPLYKFHHKEENSAKEMLQVLNLFDKIIELQGVSVVIVHHHGKRKEGVNRSQPENVRGSSVLFDYVDTSIRMVKDDSQDRTVKLDFTLRNAEDPPSMTLHLNDNLWFETDNPYKNWKGNQYQDVYND